MSVTVVIRRVISFSVQNHVLKVKESDGAVSVVVFLLECNTYGNPSMINEINRLTGPAWRVGRARGRGIHPSGRWRPDCSSLIWYWRYSFFLASFCFV